MLGMAYKKGYNICGCYRGKKKDNLNQNPLFKEDQDLKEEDQDAVAVTDTDNANDAEVSRNTSFDIHLISSHSISVSESDTPVAVSQAPVAVSLTLNIRRDGEMITKKLKDSRLGVMLRQAEPTLSSFKNSIWGVRLLVRHFRNLGT
jgi:hypothetical protein